MQEGAGEWGRVGEGEGAGVGGAIWGGCRESGTDATRPQTLGLRSGTRFFIRRTTESGQDSARGARLRLEP